tara:strand:- start:282 stop:437 length:156 start_codon:yes stop_codon:yes gene_type:complete
MSYKGQVLRGEKWFHLMSEEELAKDPDKMKDVEVYKESQAKVKETKPKKVK